MAASAYPNIVPWIRHCLQERANNLEGGDSYFDLTIKSVLRRMLSPYDIAYGDLSEDDLEAVNEAAGYRAAIKLHGSLTTGGVSNALLSEKTDDVSRTFASSEAMYEAWEGEAAVAFASTSFTPSLGGGPTSAVNGPTRARCGCVRSEWDGMRRTPWKWTILATNCPNLHSHRCRLHALLRDGHAKLVQALSALAARVHQGAGSP
ncbi:hypothetical protein EON79_03700 [bacterium]|nr:MAG: hypothetical protein EON79_03700 [bacterium]